MTGWRIGWDGDYLLDGDGNLVREQSVETRARIRLLTHRGKYVYNERLGSRINEIEITKNVNRKMDDYVREALRPMIDDGSIISIDPVETEVNHREGFVSASVTVRVDTDEIINLGKLELAY